MTLTALLTSPAQWRELPARWRWSPRIVALGFVLALTALPVLSGPSGSVLGLLAQSAQAQPVRPPGPSAPGLLANMGIMDGSNSPPAIFPAGASNGVPASNTIILEIKLASIPEGSPGPAALDKLIGHLPPDETAGPDAVARFLRETKISHTNNLRLDYLIAKDEAVTLTPGQFKAALDSFEQSDGCDILGLPRATTLSGRQTQLSLEEIMNLVTDVTRTTNSFWGGATIKYSTDPLTTGVTATLLPTVSADGCTLSVLSRMTEFVGYDKPDHPEKDYVLPLPHLRVAEIQGKGTVRMGETLALRGPACSQTNTVTTLRTDGPRDKPRAEIVMRYYLFVTANSATK
jgi:hypothetical protein